MKYIRIVKFPDRKKTAICVTDTDKNVTYVVGYINHNEELFKETLENIVYEENDVRYHIKFEK